MKKVFSPDISNGNSFDFLRVFFAFSVFFAHFKELTGTAGSFIYWPISASMGVAGFFIISGFLITRSYYRSPNLLNYITKRVRRIVPAYFFVVVICAFSLSLVSSLSFQEYFTSKVFFKYLTANLAFLNFIQPTLPGVFSSNPFPFVNGSLWTIKIELALYAFVPLMIIFLKRKPVFVFICLYISSSLIRYGLGQLDNSSYSASIILLSRPLFGQVCFFVSGAILLFYFDFFKKKIKWVLPLSIIVFTSKYFLSYWVIEFFYPLSFAILIISFAYCFKELAFISKYGDFSYGVYLYHYPIIQLFTHRECLRENPVLLFCICLGILVLLSWLSWHLLEKQFLKRGNMLI